MSDPDYIADPTRGLTVLLQSYGTKLQYEQSFGGGHLNLETEFYDSFDYADQLNTHTEQKTSMRV